MKRIQLQKLIKNELQMKNKISKINTWIGDVLKLLSSAYSYKGTSSVGISP